MPSITYDSVDQSVTPGELPRGSPGSFTPAAGQALEGLGDEGTRLAANMAHVERMRQQYDEVSRASELAGQARIKFTERFHELTSQLNDTNGDGFPDKMKGEIDDYTNAGLQQFQNPRAKAAFTEHMASIKSTFIDHSINWSYNQAQVFREGNIQNGLRGSVAAVSADPTQYEGAVAQTTKDIEGIPGEINPLALQNQLRLKNQAINELTQAAGLAWAQKYPQATKNAILGVTPQPAGETIPGKIIAAVNASPDAKKAGLDPNIALAVASAENDSFNPTRPNEAGSSAYGLFQMIDSTWAEQGGTKENRSDPNAQAQIGVSNLAANSRALKDTLRRPLTPGEIYSTQWGLGFAGVLAKMPADAPIRSAFAQSGSSKPDEAAAMNGVAGMTVGQVRQHFETLMRERMARTAGMASQPEDVADATPAPNDPPWLKNASPQLRQALLTHAEANLRRDDAGEKVALRQNFSDIEAALNDGQLPAQEWDPGKSLRTFGAVEGAALNNRMVQAQWYGYAKSQLNTADPQQTAQILAQADSRMGANEPGSFGYATAKARSESLHNAAVAINNARVADPVGQDQQSLNLTHPLDFTTPQFLTGPLAARYEQAAELQRTWNTKDYMPLSKQEADAFTDFLSKGEPSQVVQYLASARVAAGEHSERYTALMQQVAQKSPILSVAGAVAPYDSQAAQMILAGAGMVKDEKVLGIAANSNLFQQWWNTNRGQAFGAYVDNSRMNLQAVEAMYAAMLPADKRNSKVLDEDTMRMAADRIAPVIDFNGPTLVPPGMTHDQFVSQTAERYNGALTKAGYDPKEYRFNLMQFVPLPHTDGVYQAFTGSMPLQGAIIDLNKPADSTYVPVSPLALESPTSSASKQPKGAGTKSFYRGR